tara:strand:+ start:8296 stop:10338 length:2043 start_codon:yes stop_codon:yes gene_type:complete
MNQLGAGQSQASTYDALSPLSETPERSRLMTAIIPRFWLAALIVAVFIGFAVAYVHLAPKVYESVAIIYVDPKGDSAGYDGMRREKGWDDPVTLLSLAEGIRSGVVILRVVDRLELRDDPGFLANRGFPYTDAEIVELISQNIEVQVRRGTRLIDVTARDRDPERARDMADAFIEEFQSLIREQNSDFVAGKRARLEEEAARQLRRMNAAEDEVQAFRIQHVDIALNEGTDFAGETSSDLDKKLASAVSETLLRKRDFEHYEGVKNQDIEMVFDISSYGDKKHIQDLLHSRNLAKAEFVRIEKQFKPAHFTYQNGELNLAGLEEQVDVVAAEVGESIENAYRQAELREAQLRKTFKEEKTHLIEVDRVRKEFRSLLRARDSAALTYEELLARIKELNFHEGLDETAVRVFASPLIAATPVLPRKNSTVAIAGVFGAMCGLGVVIGVGLVDRTQKGARKVESSVGLPVLAEVPKALGQEMDLRESFFLNYDANSPVSESLGSLWASLSTHHARSIMIMSASPGEGKTFCAANLAVLLANKGYRTLLVDADFCKQDMAELFIDPMEREVRGEEMTSQNLCQETTFKDLYLISCGRLTSDTGEPMSEEIFVKMLTEAYSSFDYVIIDTSPLNSGKDGLKYASHAEATVLVVGSGKTDFRTAREAAKELKGVRAQLVGCILNKT